MITIFKRKKCYKDNKTKLKSSYNFRWNIFKDRPWEYSRKSLDRFIGSCVKIIAYTVVLVPIGCPHSDAVILLDDLTCVWGNIKQSLYEPSVYALSMIIIVLISAYKARLKTVYFYSKDLYSDNLEALLTHFKGDGGKDK